MKLTPGLLHGIACLGFLGLFALLMLWNTVLISPGKSPSALLLFISISPLLLPMRGFLRGTPKSCAWMAYVSLIYFIHGCGEAYASSQTRHLALLEILLSLTIFFGASFYLHLLKSQPSHGRTNPDQV